MHEHLWRSSDLQTMDTLHIEVMYMTTHLVDTKKSLAVTAWSLHKHNIDWAIASLQGSAVSTALPTKWRHWPKTIGWIQASLYPSCQNLNILLYTADGALFSYACFHAKQTKTLHKIGLDIKWQTCKPRGHYAKLRTVGELDIIQSMSSWMEAGDGQEHADPVEKITDAGQASSGIQQRPRGDIFYTHCKPGLNQDFIPINFLSRALIE